MNIWLYGLLVTIVGMVIVFVGLLLLIAIINVQAGAFRLFGNSKKDGAAEKKAQTPVPAPAPAPAAQSEDEEEIAAVIAAAVVMFEENGTGLRVKSIRRVGSNAPAWNAAGRREYLGSRY